MELTRQALHGLVYYDEASAIRPVEVAPIEKENIPNFIVCPAYERAWGRIERSMERHTARVTQAEYRLRQSKQDMADLEGAIEQWAGKAKGVSTFSEIMLDRSSASSVDRYNRDVTRHNDAVDQMRRYQDRLRDAIDKHNDLMERRNDAVREAEDRQEELILEALREIDEDLVSFFERCSAVIGVLKEKDSTEDIVAAAEASYLALKLHNAFEAHIDNSNARREVRERVEGLGTALFELCSTKELRSFLEGLFQRNIRLVEDNQTRYLRVVSLIEEAKPAQLGTMRREFQRLFEEKYTRSFSYIGIVDPARPDSVIKRMQDTVTAIRGNTEESKARYEETVSLAEAAVAAQRESESLFSAMKAAVEDSRDSMLFPGHFASDLINPDVADGFFVGKLRQAVCAVREHVLSAVGEEQLSRLIEDDDDRFQLELTKQVLAQAALTALQTDREKVAAHTRRLSAMIPGIIDQMRGAERVPEHNAERFRSLATYLYPLSCFPVLGFLATWFLLHKVEGFSSAFSSANHVYYDLKAELLDRNSKFRKINTYVFINITAALIFAQIDKRLQAYSEQGAPALEAERTSVGD